MHGHQMPKGRAGHGGGGVVRLALGEGGRAKFTDTAEEGPREWVPHSPEIVWWCLVSASDHSMLTGGRGTRWGGGEGGVCHAEGGRGTPRGTHTSAVEPANRQSCCKQANRQTGNHSTKRGLHLQGTGAGEKRHLGSV